MKGQKGWFYESHRHSLAAKGIKTGRKINIRNDSGYNIKKIGTDKRQYGIQGLISKYEKERSRLKAELETKKRVDLSKLSSREYKKTLEIVDYKINDILIYWVNEFINELKNVEKEEEEKRLRTYEMW